MCYFVITHPGGHKISGLIIEEVDVTLGGFFTPASFAAFSDVIIFATLPSRFPPRIGVQTESPFSMASEFLSSTPVGMVAERDNLLLGGAWKGVQQIA